MSGKMSIFAFNGGAMCFGHAILNLMDMRERFYEAIMMIEGTATRQWTELDG